ncbi:MAG: hypothetical protein IPM31_06985 [Anaerolineae bacterium]|nr:hypothetical protein [Anaerolineae bacterium]MBL8107143.1 hypothetical protein [Anaerolineales bacterium]MCC7188664.1 hypothetical protein [Anaerolineales bacterium]
MQKTQLEPKRKSIIWKTSLAFNILVICVFWLGVLTDYSWYNDWFSIGFSSFVIVISCVTSVMLFFGSIFQRLVVLLIGGVSILFALATIPFHRYHSHQTPTHEEISPDGTKMISMYCETNNGHGGMDHIEIIVRYRQFPFLQRDLGLYNNYPTRSCKFDMRSPVSWIDNNTIYIAEREAYLHIELIKWEKILADPGEIRGDN